jgi:hypothetical protein
MPSLPATSPYVTTPARVAMALLAGAATGGILNAVVYFLAARIGLFGGAEDREPLVMYPLTIIGSIVYGVGLLAASPFWYVLHRWGIRQWWVAASLGGGLSLFAIVAFLLAGNLAAGRAVSAFDPALIAVVATVAAIGIVVGLTVWRVAYRRREALRTDIDKGLADLAAGRLKDFDADQIIERGKGALATRPAISNIDTA